MLGNIQALLNRLPAPQAPRAPQRPQAPRRPAGDDGRKVHVGAQDRLLITFQRGNTLSQTAQAFGEPIGGGAPTARRDFLLRLIAQNGGQDRIFAGGTFQLGNDGANTKLNATLAVQKSVAARQAQGQFFPAFDYNNARVAPGPHESMLVTLPAPSGAQSFHVMDDPRGEDATAFTVFTDAEWQALHP